nr:immunoglobulin heavy chain junction region [Macaca mulatta]
CVRGDMAGSLDVW